MSQEPFCRLLNEQEAAEYLRMSQSWMAKARLTGDGPDYIKMGSRVRYERLSLDAYKNACKRSSSSQQDAA